MKESLSSTSTKNTVGMLRLYDADSAILVLEGDSDRITLSRCVDRGHCRVVVAVHGKRDVLEAIEFSDHHEFEGVLGVVDSDFVDLHETRSPSPNVFYTDLYDLDAMVFFADDLVERCLESLGGSVYDEKNEYADIRAVKSAALVIASTVGYMRLYSMMGDHQIPLENFPVERIFTGVNYEVDVSELKVILPQKCRGEPLGESDIDSWIFRMEGDAISRERISQGHDLFRGLSYAAKRRWGTAIKAAMWERLARSHWRLDHMRDQQLYRQVQDWSHRTGYRVWLAA